MKLTRSLLYRWITALFLMALPAVVHAQFTFTTNNGAITITGYTGPGGIVMIPNTTNGYNVTSIGQEAFFGCDSLTNIFIPESVTNIGSEAFAFCTNLTYAVFAGNAPPDVGNAFYGDPVAIVYHPIGPSWGPTFGGAPTAGYTSDSGFQYYVINGSITIAGHPVGFLGGVIFIPGIINGYTVTSIESMGPFPCPLSSVIIPNTVTNIAEYAFAGCTSLTNLVLPNSLTSIGTGAFAECWSLTNFVLPKSLTSIGAEAFNECERLTSVLIPESVTNIGEGVFSYCTSLTNISVAAANPAYASTNGILFDKAYDTLVQYPAGLTSNAFIIPINVTSIEGYAFYGCMSLTSITLPNSVTNIGPATFAYCSGLTNIVIPSGVSSIGTNTFYDCSKLSSVNIPNGVTSIGEHAFEGCISLACVTIPSNVTSIGDYAFAHCSYLETTYFEGNAPPDDGTAFSNDPDAIVYYLPGTTGWGPTFGGAPTELWNPQATAFTRAGNQFGFSITGPANATVVVEACTNLANPVWLPVSTNTLSGGASSFSDPQSMNSPKRFYRISAP